VKMPGDLHQGLGHLHASTQRVEACGSQAEHLPDTKTSVRAEVDRRAVARVDPGCPR
jgi:hypothetical protein